MAILIVGIILVAGAHFIYEGIVLPSFRLHVRYQLYALRDKLRALKAKQGDDISDEVFKYLHEGINGTLRILPYLDAAFVSRFNRDYENNPEIQKRYERRTQMMEKCKVQEVHNLKARLIGLTARAVIINNGGWMIYLLPIFVLFIIVFLIIGILNKCKDFLRTRIAAIVFSPDKTAQYMPVGYVIDSSAELQF